METPSGHINSQSLNSKAVAQLSLKARGLLFFIITTGSHISAEMLAKKLAEGEASIGTGLAELRAWGLLELKKCKLANGAFNTKTTITDKGYNFFLDCLAEISTYNDHFAKLLYSTTRDSSNITKLVKGPGSKNEKFSVVTSSGFDGLSDRETENLREQMREEKLLNEKLKKEQEILNWEKAQKKKHRAQFEARANKPDKTTWTPTDMSFEFADRLEKHWHIKPWRVTKTRFALMQAEARRRFETNGEIECRMMDRFFESENIFEYSDPKFLMNRYFYRYSELYSYAELTGPLSEEEIQIQRDLARKSQEWMDNL